MTEPNTPDTADTQDPTEVALTANAPAPTDPSVTVSNVDHDPGQPQPGPDENPALVDDPTTTDDALPVTGENVIVDGEPVNAAAAQAVDESQVVPVTEETQDPHLPSSPLAPPPLFGDQENPDDPTDGAVHAAPDTDVEADARPVAPAVWVDEVKAPQVGNQRVQTTTQNQASPLPNSPAPENPAVAGLAQHRDDDVTPTAGVRRNTVDERNSLAYQYFLAESEAEEILLAEIAANTAEELALVEEIKGRRRPNHPLTLAENRRQQRLAEEDDFAEENPQTEVTPQILANGPDAAEPNPAGDSTNDTAEES